MMTKKYKTMVMIEIAIMVLASVATAYIIEESSRPLEQIIPERKSVSLFSTLISFYKLFLHIVIGDKGFVSAFDPQVYTCVKSKNGSLCQEYAILSQSDIQTCNNVCSSDCLPTSRSNVDACNLGVCYDPVEGICSANAPKAQCQTSGGNWSSDSFANIPQCQRGCCFLGDQTFFSTGQECIRKGSLLGIQQLFKPEIRTELDCLVQARSQETGACVFSQGSDNTCKFGTKQSCLQLRGTFYSGLLCSNPDLKTNCLPQARTGCVDGKDEIYWLDSCGNQENIYDANKIKSYNDGKILSKGASCALGTSSNFLSNQATCGNCNFILGSKCGAKTSSQKLADTTQNFVCKDLSCSDDKGNKRANGESWCAYQGAIGIEAGTGGLISGPFFRSVDTPGSRDFRQSCINGKIQTDPCADYRNEICVEADSPLTNGNLFRTAACRLNSWQECLDYNSKKDMASCARNSDCFVKGVLISENLVFNVCSPRYPPGFDLTINPKAAQSICSLGTQKCTVVYVKEWAGTQCKQNCACETYVFGQEMNDFCMSLGDCGTKVNYIGDLTNNGVTIHTPALDTDSAYITKLKSYKDPIKGKVASPGNISNFYAEVGTPEGVGAGGKSGSDSMTTTIIGVAGGVVALGLSLAYGVTASTAAGAASIAAAQAAATSAGGSALTVTGAGYGTGIAAGIDSFLGIAPASGATIGATAGAGAGASAGAAGGATAGATASGAEAGVAAGVEAGSSATAGGGASALGTTLGAIGGALAGAAIAYSVVSLLVNWLAPGIDPNLALGLEVAGAIGGALVGLWVTVVGFSAWLGWIGVVIILLVLIVILIAAFMGIGQVSKVYVEFDCNPWQAPLGGAKCSQCGKDNGNAFGNSTLPCSPYSCHALGQTCEFLNEGTGNEMCVDVSPNDVTAPIISPQEGALQNGYSYVNVTSNGFTLQGTDSEGCVKEYSTVSFGVGLNEAGQCKFDLTHTNSFNDMANDFPDNLFSYNHTIGFSVPSLESLGVAGYDPNRKTILPMYIRCQDKNGNSNVAEYAINFCIKPGNDVTPPVISGREPVSEWVAYNSSILNNASVYTNEPSDCKWDLIDRDYDVMNNNFSCDNDLLHQQILGWKCSTTLPLQNNTNSFYVRCKDQPWLVENNGSGQSQMVIDNGQDANGNNLTTNITLEGIRTRNKDTQSYVYIVRRATQPLVISSLSPDNTSLIFGTQPVSFSLNATTSGGKDGTAICSYRWNNNDVVFYTTGGTMHQQQFQSFFSGPKEFQIKCQDSAGDIAERTARFNINIDTQAPLVSRVFDSAGTLSIVTNELSQCAVSLSSCNFDFANATLMSGSDLVHTISFSKTQTQYIKCQDTFGNAPGGCSIKVRGGV